MMHVESHEIFHARVNGVRYILKSDRPLKFQVRWTPRREYFVVRQKELGIWVGEESEEDAWAAVNDWIVESWFNGEPEFRSMLCEIKTH